MAVQSETLIAARAYEIWEKQGRPHGRDRDHWLQAVSELAEAKTLPRAKAKAAATAARKKKQQ